MLCHVYQPIIVFKSWLDVIAGCCFTMTFSLFSGPAVPSLRVQLHHGGSEEARGVGVEQSWPVSSRPRHRLETLHDVTVPQSGNRVFHLSPWTALQHMWEKGRKATTKCCLNNTCAMFFNCLSLFVCLLSTCVQCSRRRGSGGTLAGVKLEVRQTFWRLVRRSRREEVSLHRCSACVVKNRLFDWEPISHVFTLHVLCSWCILVCGAPWVSHAYQLNLQHIIHAQICFLSVLTIRV